MSQNTSVKLDSSLYDRARRVADKGGYSSAEELIEHAMEKQLALLQEGDPDQDVVNRLKGLGYLE